MIFKPKLYISTLIILIVILPGFAPGQSSLKKTATLNIQFINTANDKLIVLQDSAYINAFQEIYSLKKLKYYISNVVARGSKIKFAEKESYHLIDAAVSDHFSIEINPGLYDKLQFMIGVDSVRNFSGAQTGALDPLNDMFWTWNSGYVNFKLEGTSSASTADLNRIEHHIGGYRSPNQTAAVISFPFAALEIKPGSSHKIIIYCNLDKYWKSAHDIRIAAMPINTLPGAAAKMNAENIAQMFSLKSIE